MSFIDGLVKLFPKLEKIKFNLLSNINISVNVDKSDKRKVVLNLPNKKAIELTDKESKKLFKLLPQAVEDGYTLLEEKFDTKIQSYKKIISSNDNQKIIEYFKGKIPLLDLPILKASLYLKSLLDKGKKTWNIKKEIILCYGKRGKNISNLCSAGYFETWIKPLYEKMAESPNFEKKDFIQIYNEIVENSPFALFVSSGMKSSEIKKALLDKVKTISNYGIRQLNIHGIGDKNMTKIRETIKDIPELKNFDREIVEKNNIIVVKLIKNK